MFSGRSAAAPRWPINSGRCDWTMRQEGTTAAAAKPARTAAPELCYQHHGMAKRDRREPAKPKRGAEDEDNRVPSQEDELDNEDELDGESADEEEEEEEEEDLAETVTEWLHGKRLTKTAHLFLGLILPAAVATINMWRLSAHTVDDAYISFRYARNFARGLGLVYNAGERIEGYTNFLWTVLLGGGIKLGLDPDLLAKWLGAGFTLGTLGMVYLLSNRLRPLSVVPCVANWLLATTTVTLGYAVFGLETAMFTFLVLAGIWLMLQEEDRQAPMPWSGLVFGAAGLTRPEAPMYLGLCMLYLSGKGLIPISLDKLLPQWSWDREADSGADPDTERPLLLGGALLGIGSLLAVWWTLDKPTQLIKTVGIIVLGVLALVALVHLPHKLLGKRNLIRGTLFVAPVAAHLLWRKSYYGSWLPNTLSAKTGDMRAQLAGGTDYLLKYIHHEGLVLYLAAFGLAAGFAWRSRHLLAVATITVFGGLYVVLVGGDWMPTWRFMVPLQPFLFLLIGVAIRAIMENRSRMVNYGLILLLLLTAIERNQQVKRDRRQVLKDDKGFWDRAAGGVVAWFDEQAKKRGRSQIAGTIAMGDIGQIGYQTDLPVLDLLGLVDPVIAELPGGYTTKVGPGFRNRFFDVMPRYALIISAENDCHHPSVIGSRVLYSDRRFLQSYGVSGRVDIGDGFSWCLFEHRRTLVTNPDRPADQERRPPSPNRRRDGAPRLPKRLQPKER